MRAVSQELVMHFTKFDTMKTTAHLEDEDHLCRFQKQSQTLEARTEYEV